jgi:hypothetical protein
MISIEKPEWSDNNSHLGSKKVWSKKKADNLSIICF